MRIRALLPAGVFIGLGVAAAVAPSIVIASSRYMASPAGIYVAAALRSGIGIALLVVASGSRGPGILRIIGVALLTMGLMLPFMGVDSAKARIEWEAEHLLFLRMEGALFVLAGLVIHKLSKPRIEPRSRYRQPFGGGLAWALLFLSGGRMPPPPPKSQIEQEAQERKNREVGQDPEP